MKEVDETVIKTNHGGEKPDEVIRHSIVGQVH